MARRRLADIADYFRQQARLLLSIIWRQAVAVPFEFSGCLWVSKVQQGSLKIKNTLGDGRNVFFVGQVVSGCLCV